MAELTEEQQRVLKKLRAMPWWKETHVDLALAIINTLQAEVAALRALLDRLGFTRQDGTRCFDPRCDIRRVADRLAVVHTASCEEARRALDAGLAE